MMKRIEANDPVAMHQKGSECHKKGDYSSAFEYFTKAAKLGDIEAHYQLACCYGLGHGVEEDEKKKMFHLEEAAIGGHPKARHNLGVYEVNRGNTERAVKHFLIAANNGHDDSMKALRELYAAGSVGREDFSSTLRAYKAVVNSTKSPLRDAAEAALQTLGRM